MRVSDLFYLHQGNGLELINMTQNIDSQIRFVARTSENNGVVANVSAISNKKPFPAGFITVALGGSVLSSFVQNKPFYTGFHVMVLEPKKKMSLEEKLFYCHAIKMNAYRYQYGRQANKTLKDINLPEFPPWFKGYRINFTKIQTKNNINQASPLVIDKWQYFDLKKLFSISGSKTTPRDVLEKYGCGKYPYITTKSTNNATESFYDYYTEQGNILTIDSAVAGYCSYQQLPFSASDHVEKLTPLFPLNKYIALFLTCVINLEMYRYSYGRKCNQNQIEITKIKLPSKKINEKYEPDWQYMENYIKSLPYGDRI